MVKRKSNKQKHARGYWGMFLLSGVFSIVFWFLRNLFADVWLLPALFRRLTIMLLAIFGTLLMFGSIKWLITYKPRKNGLKSAIWLHRITRSLEKQLTDAQIGFVRGDTLKLPKIKLTIDNNGLLVKIANSIKFDSKLEQIDISASLGGYVVEDRYFSNNKDWLICHCIDMSVDFGYKFASFSAFKAQVAHEDKYHIMVDQRLTYKLHHSLIVGQTGSGKSYALYSIVLQGLLKGWQITIVDPKNASMANVGDLLGSSAKSKSEIITLIDKFFAEMTVRKNDLKEKLKSGLDKDYSDFELDPHVLIFDEYASFQSQLKAEKKDVRDKVQGQLEAIILEGRQLGFFVILAMQKSDATVVNTLIRDNLIFKCVLGDSEQQTYITTFGNSDIPQQKMSVGKGIYTLSGETQKPKILVMPELNFDIFAAFKEIVKR